MKAENRIYYREIGTKNWKKLKGISSIGKAVDYVRNNDYMGLGYIEIANHDQMLANNGQWDNL